MENRAKKQGYLKRQPVWRHGKALVELFAVMALAVETAFLTSSLVIAICALLTGLDIAFVLAVAWMRPEGSREHHPAIDRLLDDVDP
jgi:hypothetical protein